MICNGIVSSLNHIYKVFEVLVFNSACLHQVVDRNDEIEEHVKFIMVCKFSQFKHIKVNFFFLSKSSGYLFLVQVVQIHVFFKINQPFEVIGLVEELLVEESNLSTLFLHVLMVNV